jgi:hypothetical protein
MQRILECSVCAIRGKPKTMKKCAKCLTNFYCSNECQRKDWSVHKKICVLNEPLKDICKAIQRHIPEIVNDASMLQRIKPWAIQNDLHIYVYTQIHTQKIAIEEILTNPGQVSLNIQSILVDRLKEDFLRISITAISNKDCVTCAVEIPLFCFK